MEEFVGFEVNEPGGGNTGDGKRLWLARHRDETWRRGIGTRGM
jgi:hypothetical protein